MPSRFEDDRILGFYERFNRELARMPQEERHGTQLELRQHLEELLAAHEELGLSETEAVEAALSKMGDPAKLGRGMLREWQKSQESPLYAFGYCLACIGTVVASTLVLLMVAVLACGLFGQWELVDPMRQVATLLMGSAIMIVAGPLAGRRLGPRAVRAMAQASVLSVLVLALLFQIGPSDRSFEHLLQIAVAVAFVFGNAVAMTYAFSRQTGENSSPSR